MRGLTLAGGLGALALAGCSAHVHVGGTVDNGVKTVSSTTGAGTLEMTKVASLVKRLTQRRGLAAQTVSCPSNVPAQAGRVTICIAYYKGGRTGQFRVRQTDGQGDVQATAAEMIPAEIENDIEHYIARPAYSFIASCPQHVMIVVGQTFQCVARRGAQTVTLVVMIRDANGGFRWKALR